jgi:hypothetical protein
VPGGYRPSLQLPPQVSDHQNIKPNGRHWRSSQRKSLQHKGGHPSLIPRWSSPSTLFKNPPAQALGQVSKQSSHQPKTVCLCRSILIFISMQDTVRERGLEACVWEVSEQSTSGKHHGVGLPCAQVHSTAHTVLPPTQVTRPYLSSFQH